MDQNRTVRSARIRMGKLLAALLIAVLTLTGLTGAPSVAHQRATNLTLTTEEYTTQYRTVLNVANSCRYYQKRTRITTTTTTRSSLHPHPIIARTTSGSTTPWVTYRITCSF